MERDKRQVDIGDLVLLKGGFYAITDIAIDITGRDAGIKLKFVGEDWDKKWQPMPEPPEKPIDLFPQGGKQLEVDL